jgi:hypothetical protein
MDLFVEKEFIEEFELAYDYSEHSAYSCDFGHSVLPKADTQS